MRVIYSTLSVTRQHLPNLFLRKQLHNMVKARKYIYANRFDGFPKESDLKLVEEELPPIKDGEFLAEAVYLSVDPYMRAYAPSYKLGSTMIGSQLAKIIESKDPGYPVGGHVVAQFGWRTHTISSGDSTVQLVPDLEGLPLTLAMNVLGMPGHTAYFGFLEICKPQSGETVVVSGAAGAVGSIVGQIAKIKGCTVVGIAGSDPKGKWLTDELNFDHFLNYKDPNFFQKLKEATPGGVDCYFDNVGGYVSAMMFTRMNRFGRISICGAISNYNEAKPPNVPPVQGYMVTKELKMEGFVFTRWADRLSESFEQNKKWVKEGRIKYRETVTDGFENMFKAFTDMLRGGNVGKALVKANLSHKL